MAFARGARNVEDFIALQEAAADSNQRLAQLCCLPHTGHIHLQAHFSGPGDDTETSPWTTVPGATLQDVRHVLATSGRRSVRLHVHSDAKKNPPAEANFVSTLPTVTLTSAASTMLTEGGGDDGVCNICLEALAAGDEVAVMPCNGLHKYHASCLKTWLKSGSTCPCCQWAVPKSSEQRAAGLAAAKEECQRLADALPPPCQPVEEDDDESSDDESNSQASPSRAAHESRSQPSSSAGSSPRVIGAAVPKAHGSESELLPPLGAPRRRRSQSIGTRIATALHLPRIGGRSSSRASSSV